MDPSFSLGKWKDDKLIMQVRRTLPSSCGKQEGEETTREGKEEEKRTHIPVTMLYIIKNTGSG